MGPYRQGEDRVTRCEVVGEYSCVLPLGWVSGDLHETSYMSSLASSTHLWSRGNSGGAGRGLLRLGPGWVVPREVPSTNPLVDRAPRVDDSSGPSTPVQSWTPNTVATGDSMKESLTRGLCVKARPLTLVPGQKPPESQDTD